MYFNNLQFNLKILNSLDPKAIVREDLRKHSDGTKHFSAEMFQKKN